MMLTEFHNYSSVVTILNKIDTAHLLSLIDIYYQSSPRTTPLEKLYERLGNAIPVHLIAFTTVNAPEFYRVRKSLKPLKTYEDFWAPPANLASLGRLNKKNESMFYISLDPVTPIHEAKIQKGDNLTLMFYSYNSCEKINALMIEGVPSISNEEIRKIGLSEIGFCNYQIICNLIRSEFVKDVGMGTEYLYNITNLIKDMFDAENSIEGFIYSSIRNYEHKNCALKPFIAQKLLKCTGCLYGKLVDFSDSGETAIIKPMKRTLSTITNNKCVEYESFHGNGHIKLKMS